MRGRQILLGHLGGREAAALFVDGRLEDFLLDAPDQPRPGAVMRAVCERPMGGQGGMIVSLADGAKGYLRQGRDVSPGQTVLVQVTGHAVDGKAIPVTTKLTFKSALAVVTPTAPGRNLSRQITDPEIRARLDAFARSVPRPDWGLILRSAAASAEPDTLRAEIDALTARAAAVIDAEVRDLPARLDPGDGPHALARRDWSGPVANGDLEQAGVLDTLEELRSGEVPLGAGTMWLQPTRAFVAVDVDTGSDTSPAAGLKANRAAAAALPRALRLLGLGGQIVIDTAPMPKSRRGDVEAALRRALTGDPVDTALVGWTPLGHLELQRKRDRLPVLPRLPV